MPQFKSKGGSNKMIWILGLIGLIVLVLIFVLVSALKARKYQGTQQQVMNSAMPSIVAGSHMPGVSVMSATSASAQGSPTPTPAVPGSGVPSKPTPNYDFALGYDPTLPVGSLYGPTRLTNTQCNALCKGKCGAKFGKSMNKKRKACWSACEKDVCHN